MGGGTYRLYAEQRVGGGGWGETDSGGLPVQWWATPMQSDRPGSEVERRVGEKVEVGEAVGEEEGRVWPRGPVSEEKPHKSVEQRTQCAGLACCVSYYKSHSPRQILSEGWW